MTNTVHIMVAFVSQVAYTPSNINYHSVDDKQEFTCLQTNEAAICQLQELLANEGGLAKIILIETEKAREEATRSTKDWQDWMVFYGCEKMSAVDFLKKQTARKYPSLAEVFEDRPYAEDMGIEDSMRSIAAIAAHVRAFADHVRRENPAAAVVLHADMTGGFRYAAMMLLVVMQLSKYMGIRMGHVVYSDLVKDGISRIHLTDDIHRMFDLAAGADEFQKYGSVQALEEYFARSPRHSEDFSVLFAAMRRFSDAIRICRTSVIEEEMKALAEKIRAFRESAPTSVEEEMFAHIIGVIEKEYGSVIKNTSSAKSERRLDIIAWCVQKKFLQQAMTLCTEWIPEILVEKKICYTENIEVIRQCRKKGESVFQGWQQQFINVYGTEKKKGEKNPVPEAFPYGDLAKMVRRILQQKDWERIKELPKETRPRLIAFSTEYDRDYVKRRKFDLRQDIRLRIHDFDKKCPMLKKAIRSLPRSEKNPFFYEALPHRLSGLPEKDLFALFSIDVKDAEKYEANTWAQSDFEATRKAQWEKRKTQYCAMFAGRHGDSVMYTTKPVKEAIEFLHGYFNIRNERNYSNHAVKGAVQGNEPLENFIAAYIEKLRNA